MGEPIAEVGYLAGICGHDGTVWVKLVTDGNGYLKVTLPYEEALGARVYNFDGASWRKSNLLWGYNALLDVNLGGTATGTSYSKSTSAIPSGEIWIVQGASLRNQTRNVTAATIYAYRASGAYLVLADKRPLTQCDAAYFVGATPFMTGDVIYVAMAGTVSGDEIWANVAGYKMKVNM